MAVPPEQFARSLVRAESCLLVYSVCLLCGEGKLLSPGDGSLNDWEDGHQCRKKPRSSFSEDNGRKRS